MNQLDENKELVLFENNKIRRKKYHDEWFYSIVDIVEILTESKDPQAYWRKLKQRLKEEGNESVTTCHKLKLVSKKDGKRYKNDCANRENIFRLIQSIPSPNAEPFKLWFAKLAEERILETIDPSITIERARQTYLKKGYTDEWINARIKGIPARNELTYEWKNRGITDSKDFAILTDEISLGTFDITTLEHKTFKHLRKNQNLRDHMSPLELALTTLAEVTTTELYKANDSQGINELTIDAHDGGDIASITRKKIEKKIKKPVVTKENAINFQNKKTLIKRF